MKPNNSIYRIWHFIVNQGVDDPESQQGKRIILLNQAAFLTALGAFAMALYCYFTQPNTVYLVISLSLVFSYSAIIVIHHFRKPRWVHYYLVFFGCLWVYAAMILNKGFFSQGVVCMSTVMLSYFFFNEQKKVMVAGVVFNCVMYVLSSTYISLYGSYYSFNEMPFDESLVFLLTLCWIYIIFKIWEQERSNLINDLMVKNKELEDRTEELKRFTYIASHDLKSPLRTIISFLGLMERDLKKGSLDKLSNNLEFVRSGAQQLNYLIKDVLELSKLNEKKQKETEVVDLSKCLEKVLLNLKSEIDEKKCTINAGILPQIKSHEVEVMLVFQNLIQNGIKYNDTKKPVINIWSEVKEDKLMIHFEDNGIGIEEEYFEQIFEMFKRLHNSEKYKGTGLGLSLCKKVIQGHGGDIKVTSSFGEGSIFTVLLPVEILAIRTLETAFDN